MAGGKMIRKRNVLLGLFLLFILIVAGCTSSGDGSSSNGAKIKAIVYKSQSCGCCGQYVEYLKSKGFEVEVKLTENMDTIKNQYNIPVNMQSCHTTVIGKYFVEGHMPFEAINKLLSENPDISGIALPGMPSGSPGMPGPQSEPFMIYSVKNGVSTPYFTIG